MWPVLANKRPQNKIDGKGTTYIQHTYKHCNHENESDSGPIQSPPGLWTARLEKKLSDDNSDDNYNKVNNHNNDDRKEDKKNSMEGV